MRFRALARRARRATTAGARPDYQGLNQKKGIPRSQYSELERDLSELSMIHSFVIPHHPRNLHYPAPSLSRRHTMEMTLHFPLTLTSTFLSTLVLESENASMKHEHSPELG